ncbi:MAG: hypothetical protein MUF37_01670 [Methanoregulaceae archaeon]|nr:hypothetical protein [Methanoregulaceae archaeon]
MRWMEKSFVTAILTVLICTMLLGTVSATTVDFGKSNQLFTQKVSFSKVPGSGSTDVIKATPYKSYLSSFTIIKPQASAPYFRKLNSYSPSNYVAYQTTLPISYPTITPVPEQGIGTTTIPGSSSSSLGGFIIRGTEGDWINMRSNFYDPSMGIYDGRWHYHVGTIPAYWENMALPGSYTIQIAHRDTDVVYYCETVIVYPGKTIVIQANNLCPLCSSC